MITADFTQTFETVITLVYNLPLYYYFHKLYGLHIKLLVNHSLCGLPFTDIDS